MAAASFVATSVTGSQDHRARSKVRDIQFARLATKASNAAE